MIQLAKRLSDKPLLSRTSPHLHALRNADIRVSAPMWALSRRRTAKSPARSRLNYLPDAAEPSGAAGAKPHGVPRSEAATIHADAASKKVTKVSEH